MEARTTSDRDLSRIAAFTDGVMAVAITLLVLNIQVPTLEQSQNLDDALVDLLPSLGAYVLAFALVGRFWVIHHNLFEKMRDFDRTLMAMNLTFLALIVLVPFSAELAQLSEHPVGPLAFAGEHLGGRFAALMEGAIRSGGAAARALLRQ